MAETTLTLEGLAAQMQTLQEGYAKMQEENSALKAKLAETAADHGMQESETYTIPSDIVAVGKRKFQFTVARLIYKGKQITAVDAMSDSEVMQYLVDKKSECIKEVFSK